MPVDASDANEPLVRALSDLASASSEAETNLTIEIPGLEPVRLGRSPERARVVFDSREAAMPLLRNDLLGLLENFLQQRIEIEGDLVEVAKLNSVVSGSATWRDKILFAIRLLVRNRSAYNRESVAFHYERPADFFLTWLDRWRSYSHGLYESPDDLLTEAQARKLQFAIDALGLKSGMEVLDVGGGWGCFVEYAGLQGIRVHAITISHEQHRFVRKLIEEKELPCTVELVDFVEYRPDRSFDGVVFLGTFEHLPGYRQVTGFLREYLKPGQRFYADFCARRDSQATWGFLKKHIFTGTTAFVDVPKLIRAVTRAGFNIHEFEDDTLSYAYTVRDWAIALERSHADAARVGGEAAVRAFLLWLWASHLSLLNNRTQAYHLVGASGPRAVR